MYLFKEDEKMEWTQFITSFKWLHNLNYINIRLNALNTTY